MTRVPWTHVRSVWSRLFDTMAASVRPHPAAVDSLHVTQGPGWRHHGPQPRTHRRHSTKCHAGPRVLAQQEPSPQVDPCTQSATSAYVHLPFCKRKCWYCDFPVQAVGSKLTSPRLNDRMEVYVEQVVREVQATGRQGQGPLQTVYFGGGTPSLVPPPLVGRILDTLDKQFGIAADAEITLEADPGTFDVTRLRAYLALGVNRLSMGVQSFQQELLEGCGRSHSAADIHRAIQAVHDSGVRSWSLDLISGLPHLTQEKWLQSLEQAIQAQPSHVSVYDLQVEEGTPFARWYSPGSHPLPTDQDAAAMYALASHTLTAAGYEHYEVSNYGRPGHRSRHNQVYWTGAPYYAFGQGAASFLQGRRFSRPASYRAYSEWLDKYTAGGGEQLPGAELPPQSKEDRMLEGIMLRLRTADGLDMEAFRRLYGADTATRVQRSLAKHAKSGHVLVRTREGGHAVRAPDAWQTGDAVAATPDAPWACVRLSDPEGFLVSNDIISDVFAALSDLTT